MEAQARTIDQPFHGAYEKFIEITSHLSAKSVGEETHSDIEASLESDGRAWVQRVGQPSRQRFHEVCLPLASTACHADEEMRSDQDGHSCTQAR